MFERTVRRARVAVEAAVGRVVTLLIGGRPALGERRFRGFPKLVVVFALWA